jgi:hypothetical protein
MPSLPSASGKEGRPDAAEASSATVSAAPGYRHLLQRRDVALYAALTLTSSLLSVAVVALLVVRADELGLGEGGLGLFIAVSAVGALAGGVIAGGGAYDGPRAFALAGLASLVGTIGLILFAITGSALLACAALLLTGLVGPLEEIASTTAFQNTLPDGVYGRVFSLFLWTGAAGGLLGGLAGPALAELVGAGQSLLLLAIPDVLLALLFAVAAGGARWRRGRHGELAPAL